MLMSFGVIPENMWIRHCSAASITFTSHFTNSFTICLVFIDDITNSILSADVIASRKRLLHVHCVSQIITCCWCLHRNRYTNFGSGAVAMDTKFIMARSSPCQERNWWAGIGIAIYYIFSTGTGNEHQAWRAPASVLIQSKDTFLKVKRICHQIGLIFVFRKKHKHNQVLVLHKKNKSSVCLFH